jgi:D-glycero-D-manno-heptose 1,7-bisphosphate phosphatase
VSRAVFLDRDGTLLVERGGPPTDPEAVELVPGAAAAVRELAGAGWRRVVVTNQSGLARGHYDLATYRAVTGRMRELLAAEGATLDAVCHCPHHPEGAVEEWSVVCDCRKPAPGLLLRAAEELGLDLAASWCIGDAARDVESGRAAGCRTILVLTGKGRGERERIDESATRVAADLREAARIVLAEGEGA